MADEFEMAQVVPGFVTVLHLEEGHRYTFHVAEDSKGKRVLGEAITICQAQPGAKHVVTFFTSHARAFAEREARKAGLID